MRELGGRREKNRFEREKERERGRGRREKGLRPSHYAKHYKSQHPLQLRVGVLFIGLECKLTLMSLLSLTSN